MPEKDAKSPATTSFAHDAMMPQWTLNSTVMGGTEAMREAGQDVLPQHDEESHGTYEERRGTAVLYNLTKLTVQSWVGKPLGRPIVLQEDIPEEILPLLEDIDLQGNNLDVFARRVFQDGLVKSFSHVLVEFPRINRDVPRTRADDLAEGVRPYWVHVKPENVIAAHATLVRGEEILDHVRIREVEIERDGFAEVAIEQIRVYDRLFDVENNQFIVRVGLWRVIKDKNRREEWREIDNWTMDTPVIPLATFYADRDDFMIGRAPVSDLAILNVRHYQSTSDQIMAVTTARFPILAVSGAIDEDDVLRVGPKEWLHVPDPQGKFYYVENKGTALQAGREDLRALEEQMAAYGAEFLRKRGRMTATERLENAADARAPLEDMAVRFNDALNLMLIFTARWLGLDEGGTVKVNTEFGFDEKTAADFDALKEARRNKDISRERFLRGLQLLGSLPQDFDFEQNKIELAAEEPEPEPKDE